MQLFLLSSPYSAPVFMQVSPDGAHILVASQAAVSLLHASTHKVVWRIEVSSSPGPAGSAKASRVRDIRWASCGRMLAVLQGAPDKTAAVWLHEASSGQELWVRR